MGKDRPAMSGEIVLSGEISRREARERARQASTSASAPAPGQVLAPVTYYQQQVETYEPGLSVRLPVILARALWRWRWQVGVIAAVAAVARIGAALPVATALTLAAVGAGAWWWARSRRRVLGRMLLSARERSRAAWWAGGGATWAAVAAVAPPVAGAWWALVIVVAVPSWQLACSRMPTGGTGRREPWVRDVLARWPVMTSSQGCPMALGWSRIDHSSVEAPDEGTMTATVHLSGSRHGRDAIDGATRRFIEASLDLPTDTVQLDVVREHSRRVQLTIARGRTLETEPAAWPGPVIRDGLIPLAVDESGRDVSVRAWGPEGTESVFVCGTKGSGKSSTSAALLLPGIAEGWQTLWYIDGKGGGSAPYLRPACDWYASKPDQWAAVIDAAWRVMRFREQDRGERGLWEWRGPDRETDPVLCIAVDEGATIGRSVSSRTIDQWSEMCEKDRSLGIRIAHFGQSPRAEHIMGGAHVREQLAGNGTVVAHRAGGGQSARLSLDSVGGSTHIDLTTLPPGPGWAAIARKGEILAERARVRYASGQAAGEAARAVTVRPLSGGDATSAGEAYSARWRGQSARRDEDVEAGPGASWADLARRTAPVDYGPALSVQPIGTMAPPVRSADKTAAQVLSAVIELAGQEGRDESGLARREIVAATGLGDSTVSRVLRALAEDGEVTQTEGQRWLPGGGTE